ncbi:hypothetical protein F9817_19320 [Vibrio sp. CAIM 722]|uniref:TM2 domain-containing protein n=1 Tax=Vibrio eleionomae TaxID=2653505 RepID=A0A7X4LNU8_9VIBR|nr:hypothetical protein [Vibrio eleionomae]MZI95329.1 hypothetical protein [Vibrio eleionomae]
MNIFESNHDLEEKEQALSQQVHALEVTRKRYYFAQLAARIKDPDTYAVLNWSFIGGFHHLYLGRYGLFLGEIFLLIVAITTISLGITSGWFIIGLLVLFELPQLFFSQKIVRQYNYSVSTKILCEAREKPLVEQ